MPREALARSKVSHSDPALGLFDRNAHARHSPIKDSETDAVVICRAADWTDKEKRAAVVSVMRLAELPDINWFNYEEPTM